MERLRLDKAIDALQKTIGSIRRKPLLFVVALFVEMGLWTGLAFTVAFLSQYVTAALVKIMSYIRTDHAALSSAIVSGKTLLSALSSALPAQISIIGQGFLYAAVLTVILFGLVQSHEYILLFNMVRRKLYKQSIGKMMLTHALGMLCILLWFFFTSYFVMNATTYLLLFQGIQWAGLVLLPIGYMYVISMHTWKWQWAFLWYVLIAIVAYYVLDSVYLLMSLTAFPYAVVIIAIPVVVFMRTYLVQLLSDK